MRKNCLPLLFLALVFTSCQPDPTPILGAWEAVEVQENGDSLKLDPSEIGFEFQEDQRYHYRSTLNYREAGTWRLENGYLYAQDTTGKGADQYVVAVELLRADSLVLRMKATAGERRVVLLRK